MVVELSLILVGLAVILVSGDLLVRGAVGLATALKIPLLIVSLTVVAFGTSAPELAVAILSVLGAEPGIALGNIIGANIANALFVLGLPALIHPIPVSSRGLAVHAAIMLGAALAFAGVAYATGMLGRATGAALFAGILAYVGFMWFRATHGAKDDPVIDEAKNMRPSRGSAPRPFFISSPGSSACRSARRFLSSTDRSSPPRSACAPKSSASPSSRSGRPCPNSRP